MYIAVGRRKQPQKGFVPAQARSKSGELEFDSQRLTRGYRKRIGQVKYLGHLGRDSLALKYISVGHTHFVGLPRSLQVGSHSVSHKSNGREYAQPC